MNKNMAKKISTEPKMNYDLNLLQDMYKKMLLIRRFEEKAGQLYGMGQIGGFCHLYIGQEAVVVGIQSAQIDGRNRGRTSCSTGYDGSNESIYGYAKGQ